MCLNRMSRELVLCRRPRAYLQYGCKRNASNDLSVTMCIIPQTLSTSVRCRNIGSCAPNTSHDEFDGTKKTNKHLGVCHSDAVTTMILDQIPLAIHFWHSKLVYWTWLRRYFSFPIHKAKLDNNEHKKTIKLNLCVWRWMGEALGEAIWADQSLNRTDWSTNL